MVNTTSGASCGASDSYTANESCEPADASPRNRNSSGTNAVLADPLLDATYHLTSGSPARDAGAVVSDVTVDYDGGPRPVGGYDIGADEIALRCYLPLLMMGYTM